MSINEALFPNWEGLTPTRQLRTDDKAPDFEDWDQITAEVLEHQNQINAGLGATLAAVLAIGKITGPNNIQVSNSQRIDFLKDATGDFALVRDVQLSTECLKLFDDDQAGDKAGTLYHNGSIFRSLIRDVNELIVWTGSAGVIALGTSATIRFTDGANARTTTPVAGLEFTLNGTSGPQILITDGGSGHAGLQCGQLALREDGGSAIIGFFQDEAGGGPDIGWRISDSRGYWWANGNGALNGLDAGLVRNQTQEVKVVRNTDRDAGDLVLRKMVVEDSTLGIIIGPLSGDPGIRLAASSNALQLSRPDTTALRELRTLGIRVRPLNSGNFQADLNNEGLIFGANQAIAWTNTNDNTSASRLAGLALDGTGRVKVTDGLSGAGSIVVRAGTQSGPGVAFDNDPNTGIFNPVANTLGLLAGGSAACVVREVEGFVVTSTRHYGFAVSVGNVADLSLRRIARAHLAVADPANDQSTNVKTSSIELTALSGASVTAAGLFPDGVIRLGVSIHVTTTITGATSFDIGDGTDVDMFGAAIALSSGTTTNGSDATASPLAALLAAGDVVLTAVGSDFTAGAVRVVAHYLDITAPTS